MYLTSTESDVFAYSTLIVFSQRRFNFRISSVKRVFRKTQTRISISQCRLRDCRRLYAARRRSSRDPLGRHEECLPERVTEISNNTLIGEMELNRQIHFGVSGMCASCKPDPWPNFLWIEILDQTPGSWDTQQSSRNTLFGLVIRVSVAEIVLEGVQFHMNNKNGLRSNETLTRQVSVLG